MEEGAKRRLVGAAVVVVLVVIFLPMLLKEEDRSSPVSEREMSAPPRPDFDRGYDTSVRQAPIEPSVSSFAEPEGPVPEAPPIPRELPPSTFFEAPATAQPEYQPEVESESEPDLQPLPESVPEAEPEPAPALVEEKPPSTSKPVTKPIPARTSKPESARPPKQKSPSPTSWVIQVASLQDRARAYALVQDLRAKGFPAYMEEAEVKHKLWHRVRIGPEVKRKQIESMAASLEGKTGMKGQIQRYP